MKKALLILFSLAQVGLVPSTAHAVNRLVTYFGNGGAGSLRLVIQGSCEDPGDDIINFVAVSEVHIVLESPLKIPDWCDGKITINGLPGGETILDGSAISAATAFQEKAAIDEVAGTLEVMTSGNIIRGITFVGFKDGSGITLMGNDNLVEDNFFGIYRKTDNVQPNQFGIVFSGNGNTIRENTITGNDEEGILGDGHDNVIQSNQVGTKEGLCPPPEAAAGEDVFSYVEEIIYLAYGTSTGVTDIDLPKGCGNGGSGIQLVHHASDNVIGGNNSNQGNTIVYNQGEGITLIGDGTGNFHSHNVIAGNKGLPVNINWDNKINKGEKYVVGTNAGIPTLDFTATPLDLENASGYQLKGKGVVGATAEIYLAPADGKGALEFLEEFVIPESPFSHDLEDPELSPGRTISALVCDDDKNCSELSSVALDRDVDHDSLPDGEEEDTGLSPWENDTDGDGLADPLEKQEVAFEKDSDGDGISDFIETGGDGNYDPQEGDTDPLKVDTDGDGLKDGDEDKNQDGIIQLGETSPLG